MKRDKLITTYNKEKENILIDSFSLEKDKKR